MSAVDLLAAYKTTQALARRGRRRRHRPHRDLGAQAQGALCARLRKARKDAKEWRSAGRRAAAGALDGVPITIKENIATKGVPVPLGTAATELAPAAADAPPAARVREAGAVILAKTTMPDYGMLSSGRSSSIR